MDPSSIEIERVEEKADTWIFFPQNFRFHQRGWIYTTIELMSKWLDDKRAAFDTRSRVIGLKRNSVGLDKLVTGYIWQYNNFLVVCMHIYANVGQC